MFRWESAGGAADAWICSCDIPHNKGVTAQRLARLVSHAHQSAGPLQRAGGGCFPWTPSPVLQSLGLPSSGAMGPRIHGDPDYVCVLPSGWRFHEGLTPCRSGSIFVSWVGSTWSREVTDEKHGRSKQREAVTDIDAAAVVKTQDFYNWLLILATMTWNAPTQPQCVTLSVDPVVSFSIKLSHWLTGNPAGGDK